MSEQQGGPADFTRPVPPQPGGQVDAYGRPLAAGEALPPNAYGPIPPQPGDPGFAQPLYAAASPQAPRKRSAARTVGVLAGATLAGAALTLGGLVGLFELDRATGSRLGPPNQASSTTPALPPATSTSGSAGSPGSQPSQQVPGASASGMASTQKDATAAQSKGVVLIRATLPNGVSAGSGMVIDPSGLVLTNYHVVQGSTALKVTIASSDKTYTATVVGHDATHDVALLRLRGASGLDAVTLDDDAVAAGDRVTAVGNAQGQGFLTAAAGSVTNTAASITVNTDTPGATETLDSVYETDAAAQPGDSGGPLFDAENEVAGMTTAGEQASTGGRRGGSTTRTVASYAIPIDRAMAIVKQIEAGDSSGTVVVGAKAYLGIMVSASGDEPVITAVTAGTPAAKAGITEGSQLTSIAGQSVGSQAEIAAALGRHRAGDAVKIAWTDADGDAHSATVVLASSPVN